MKTRKPLVAAAVMCLVPAGVFLLCRDCGGRRAAGPTDTGLTANAHAGTATANRYVVELTRVDAALPESVRRDALSKLPDRLSDADLNALTNFLSTAPGQIPGVAPDEQLGLKNDLLNFLLARHGGRGLAAFLSAEFFNPARDTGWRDYALQAWPALWGHGRETVLDGYRRIFGAPEFRAFRGTALCGAARLLRDGEDLRPLTAESMAASVLRDPDAAQASLVTALGFCREFGLAGRFRPEITALAESSPFPLARRAAASLTE